MTGYSKINFINSILVLIINLVLNIILIPLYAGIGAAVATLTSMLFLGGIRLIQVWYLLRLQPLSFSILKPFFSSIIVYFVMINVKPFIMSFHTVITLLIAGLLIFIFFIFFLWLMGLDDDDDKHVISTLKLLMYKLKRV